MGQDDARARILARRLRFLSSALLAVAGCGTPVSSSGAAALSPPAGPATTPDPASAGAGPSGAVADEGTGGVSHQGQGGSLEAADAGVDAAAPKVVVRVCLSIDILQSVQFAAGSPHIQARDHALLDEVVKVAGDHPDVHIELQGHTSAGEGRYGVRLDVKRAEAVRQYLLDHGVDASRLCVRGYGEERPRAPSLREEDRAKNRRVEFFRMGPDAPCSP